MSIDNNSLEDMVEKTLESAGVLSKMRAELRANVFHILEKGSSFQDKSYTDTIKKFTSNDNGVLLMSLVKNLFEYLGLSFTASVFDSETGAGQNFSYKSKDDIYKEVLLPEDDKKPIILQILELHKIHYVKDLKINQESKLTGSNDLSLDNTSTFKAQLDIPQKTIDFHSSPSKSASLTSIKSTVLQKNVYMNEKLSQDNKTNHKNHSEVNISDNHPTDNESMTASSLKIINEESNSESENNQNESSLDEIETDENMTVGNDSIQSSSTDLSLGKIAS
ncbi:uncharacterized protein LOC126894331 isoform X1 [Daktulosphaira vitifoliae]|uniref:uncharacterized protein LOC126894331 isoform X1 n=1 Tax=Daktulosphaira vitifoliae TaxID=58002 RepID=UPI0021A9E992|nr:uncharacterized protein LOC126894331 isoform X1 [Daktulosphaira vitifoliae]XP_050521222.1 uncharacterized protein LOC126894331 isoform X1 [Daktulosphaira vitifoliae]